MRWLIWGVIYLAGHFLLYAVVLRRLKPFSREGVIFRYHLFSAVAVVSALLGGMTVTGRWGNLVAAVGVLSLQGIYSMSFLELWSLAQGGYSLGILEHVERGKMGTDLSPMYEIGASKKQDRVEGLQRLGLLHRDGEEIILTGFGRVVAAAAWGVRQALNLRHPA